MSSYCKKPIVIEATQWFKNGDHPLDNCLTFNSTKTGEPFRGEGKIVRYYRDPDVSGKNTCRHCELSMKDHGWIDTLESGHTVCPGDYIITSIQGEHYPCKPDIFHATYKLNLKPL